MALVPHLTLPQIIALSAFRESSGQRLPQVWGPDSLPQWTGYEVRDSWGQSQGLNCPTSLLGPPDLDSNSFGFAGVLADPFLDEL